MGQRNSAPQKQECNPFYRKSYDEEYGELQAEENAVEPEPVDQVVHVEKDEVYNV